MEKMRYVTDRCKALGMISLHVLIIYVQQLREACSGPGGIGDSAEVSIYLNNCNQPSMMMYQSYSEQSQMDRIL